MYKALYLSPMVPTTNAVETSRFFVDVLGFESFRLESGYTILTKDGLTLHLLPAGEDIGQTEFYLEVDDVDAVWEGMKDKIAGLRFREPFDRDYGMREIHIDIPETNTLLFIGQTITT